MNFGIKIAVALALFVLWGFMTFYAGILIYLLPAKDPLWEGTPQFLVGIVVLLASMISYAYTASRLFGKE
ncbi:MAG TPA: hypothetical protein VGR19_09335 [Allosphingosinicella sp.]|nr:hypothetical protein [Allosphingosinicella sp.]